MQDFGSFIAVPSTSVQPLTVVDSATLARVAGGAGPHGGWSAPAPAPVSSLESFGPHGGWRADFLGPHGGW